jgi:hypothetical protein
MKLSYKIFLTIINIFIFLPLLSFSSSPIINNNFITFNYADQNAKEVTIIFSFDQYKMNYHMLKQKDGTFTLTLNTDLLTHNLKSGKYYYKLIVDGIYTHDPLNPNLVNDPYLGEISYFSIDDLLTDNNKGPVKVDESTVRFYYVSSSFADKINRIMLVGNFNRFKPYEFYLKRSSEDSRVWYVDVPINKDQKNLQYMFVVDGAWVKDPHNSQVGINEAGQEVSLFYVP